MRVLLTILAVLFTGVGEADLVARWKGNDFRDALGRYRLQYQDGTATKGNAIDFQGDLNGGAFTADGPEFVLTRSLSVSCWVYPRAFSHPLATSPQAQIVFRGDDRSGLDPYHLTLSRTGYYAFGVAGPGETSVLHAPAKLNAWAHLLGTLDDATGEMRLYVNGKLAAELTTNVRPLGPLDPNYRPGIAIGNTQFPQGGRHRQPFDGMIRDVRIYNEAVSPRTAMR